ncbi:hypothetical protein INF37_13525 [Pseudoflavonifractor sp. DSM 107456]|uniref:Uncharacterized protein n=1 Tax=Pseudoflavonifractor gallinarum TaxID=2779352 RepID=A0ABR9RE91_9FIRM|nr:hypothetical protein [Pseudoflavonifractor gallinarum]MBE5057006.1 hypothetical protein [Pseudoflavonifractor gallinarum]
MWAKEKDFLTAAKHDSRQKVLLPIGSAHTARHPRDAVVLTIRPDTQGVRNYSLFHVMSMYHKQGGKSSKSAGKDRKFYRDGGLFTHF